MLHQSWFNHVFLVIIRDLSTVYHSHKRFDFFHTKVYIVNRKVKDVTLREEIKNLVVENRIQKLTAPKESLPGIYTLSITHCPKKTFEQFEDFVARELTESSNNIGELEATVDRTKRKRKKPLTMSTKSKKKKESIKQKAQICLLKPNKVDWMKSPVFDTIGYSPREYINAYWKSNGDGRPERYGFVYEKSLFKDNVEKLNISNLGNPIESTYDTQPVEGVNSTMILIAGSHTSFPWHNENKDLASINYMHYGADKYWVAIHRKSTSDFREKLIHAFKPFELMKNCSNPIKHKNYGTSLDWLDANQIEYSIVSFISNLFY